MKCSRCAEREAGAGVVSTTANEASRRYLLCDPCMSFVLAAIEGRAVYARGSTADEPALTIEALAEAAEAQKQRGKF